jgi:DNA-binding beta-propeller fold protein YncE
VDSQGNVYVADTGNDTIRKITPVGTNWVVSTFVGLAGNEGSADGVGANAQFDYPTGVAVDNAGNVYVADQDNNAIRKIDPDGTVTTLVGGAESSVELWDPSGVAVDMAGDLYIADTDDNTVRVGQIPIISSPILYISRLGRTIILSWPQWAVGYVLETSATLAPTPHWSPLANSVSALGGNFVVTNTMTGTSAYYRLSKVGITANPILQITQSGNQVVLSWPQSAVGFVLEMSDKLGPGAQWSEVANNVAALGQNFTITNNTTGAAGFYRLRQQ